MELRDLLNTEKLSDLEGSTNWNREVFARAYKDQFDPVLRLVDTRYPVLVYVPGRAMTAAADYAKSNLRSNASGVSPERDWESREFGKPTKNEREPSKIWQRTTGLLDRIWGWLQSPGGAAPHAIFHNLDLLFDAAGHIRSDEGSQTALMSLLEATRSGMVLGLADRDAGRIPALERLFTDKVVLREMSFEGFKRIIPQRVGMHLCDNQRRLPEAYAWQLYSRLRWSDPMNAVQIMDKVAQNNSTIQTILDQVRQRTCPVGFELAPKRTRAGLAGYARETVEDVERLVIEPFKEWLGSQAGDIDSCKREQIMLRQGVIFHGPPGTGKTRLARHIAAELGLPIRLVTGAEIKGGIFGDAEKNVHALFRELRRAAPCVVVLDDADDLAKERNSAKGSVAGAEIGIVNAMLAELDGFDYGALKGVMVIMTTNRVATLDPAIRERLDPPIRVPYPLDRDQLKEIIEQTAIEYAYDLAPDVTQALVEFYFGSVKPDPTGKAAPTRPEDRRKGSATNLFSPRLIARSMLILGHKGNRLPGNRHRPLVKDVELVKEYFARRSDDD